MKNLALFLFSCCLIFSKVNALNSAKTDYTILNSIDINDTLCVNSIVNLNNYSSKLPSGSWNSTDSLVNLNRIDTFTFYYSYSDNGNKDSVALKIITKEEILDTFGLKRTKDLYPNCEPFKLPQFKVPGFWSGTATDGVVNDTMFDVKRMPLPGLYLLSYNTFICKNQVNLYYLISNENKNLVKNKFYKKLDSTSFSVKIETFDTANIIVYDSLENLITQTVQPTTLFESTIQTPSTDGTHTYKIVVNTKAKDECLNSDTVYVSHKIDKKAVDIMSINAKEIKVYPNPIKSGEQLIIEGLEFPYSYQLINANGKIIQNGELNSNTISLRVEPGVYLLKSKDYFSRLIVIE